MSNMIRLKILTILFFCGTAIAENAEEALVKSCNKYIKADDLPEDSVCYEYINGFIDGAILTDSAIIDTLSSRSETEGSDFFKRAYKTRLGSRGKTPPATYFAKFCLPENGDRHEIVRSLVHALDGEAFMKTPFRELLYDALKKTYVCDDWPG
ncbi:Rap1a/Tai family immunity protein [Marinicella sp. W31]|uniref:Rap1a/Tai family immunity protein n=1 Tax=Marinicella sp. W31 TaxID=3023713 RepID=UPI0037584267